MHALLFQAISLLLGQQAVPFAQVERHAAAIEAAVEQEPLPFSGPRAREKSALLLAVVAHRESGLREEIEYCTFESRRGMTQDDGRSIGLTQLYQGYARYGHSREEICGDAELQFRLALRFLTAQTRRCGSRVERGISAYNSNQCSVSRYGSHVWATYRRLARRLGL